MVTLVFSGCLSSKGLFTQSSRTAASSLAADKSLANAKLSPAAWPRSDWWKQFNDPQLDQLMDEALSGSPTLRIAEARVRRALAFTQSTKAALYPQANGGAVITRERFPGHALIPPTFAGQWETQAQIIFQNPRSRDPL